MTREEFVETFLEGAKLAPVEGVLKAVLGALHDERYKLECANDKNEHTIEFMNEVVRDCGWTMKCSACGCSYEPDCELSEMFGAENYCGKSQWCCP